MTTRPEIFIKAIADATAAMDAGGGVVTLNTQRFLQGSAKNLVAMEAKQRGFIAKVTAFTNEKTEITLTRDTEEKQRGAPKSPTRLTIEALKPGQFDFIDIEETSRESVRVMVQAISRATQRRFTTQATKDGFTMVTRIDSLQDASPTLRRAIEREINKPPKWPFNDMAVGETRTVNGDHSIESARSMAQHQKNKHQKAFSVSNTVDGIVIKRTL